MTTDLKPITISELSTHFVEIYRLSHTQAESVIASAAKSISISLSGCVKTLSEGRMADLAASAHNLKGVLLNMGQPQWADVARRLEEMAREGRDGDCRDVLAGLREGGMELVRYYKKRGDVD